ncbi:MAG: SDR family oxidoreductase, partial [Steroidobacteraceae bacterium]
MRILVCGASGFIGQAVTLALRTAGHEVVRGVRRPQHPGDIRIDYSTDGDAANWRPRLDGFEAVVNAVGIITERPDAKFENLHERAPIALFEACARSTVRRVVQVSALGAETGDTGYFRSKRAADLALMRLPLEWQILRPSLVYGESGTSASAFRMLSSLPLIPIPTLPASPQFQPVHIDDLAAAVVIALDPRTPPRQCIDCVGSTRHTFREMLSGYRAAFGLGPAVWLPIPAVAMAIAARIANLVPNVPLTPETWRMLKQGNAGNSSAFAQLLGRAPKGLSEFIPVADAERLCARAMSTWQLPLLRVSLAAVWILSGVVSAFLYPRSASLALLAPVGLTGALAAAVLYSASALDLVLGVATLLYPRRITWIAQALLIVGYSLTIAVAMPGWLLHPFGPVLK